MSRYDHKIETSLEGIEHLSREKKEEKERKMKEKNHYYNPLKIRDFSSKSFFRIEFGTEGETTDGESC